MNNWTYNATPQPIETAPDTWILVWIRDRWVSTPTTKGLGEHFTHWLPMPPPPPQPESVPQDCPKCGGTPEVRNAEVGEPWLICTRASCQLGGPIAETECEAIRAWNRIRYEK